MLSRQRPQRPLLVYVKGSNYAEPAWTSDLGQNLEKAVSAYQDKSLREVYEGYEEATFRYSKLHCNRTMLFAKYLRIKIKMHCSTEKISRSEIDREVLFLTKLLTAVK